MEKIFEDVGL